VACQTVHSTGPGRLRYPRTMNEPATTAGTPDVPAEVFARYLDALAAAGVSVGLVARLRKILIEEQNFTERALKAAVLGEEPRP
jgi:hypothetical protein